MSGMFGTQIRNTNRGVIAECPRSVLTRVGVIGKERAGRVPPLGENALTVHADMQLNVKVEIIGINLYCEIRFIMQLFPK